MRALQPTRKVVTVLVVEDDWVTREDIVTDLRQEGCAVLEAATGVGALQALREAEKDDLLITDIGLADALTGWDVAEAFRTSHPEVPVIYASGNPETIIAALRAVLSQQAGSRFRAYRDLPQASGAAKSAVTVVAPWLIPTLHRDGEIGNSTTLNSALLKRYARGHLPADAFTRSVGDIRPRECHRLRLPCAPFPCGPSP